MFDTDGVVKIIDFGSTYVAGVQEAAPMREDDGIMSAIDFEMSVKRVENTKGDRVKIEMSGKYLQYNAW